MLPFRPIPDHLFCFLFPVRGALKPAARTDLTHGEET